MNYTQNTGVGRLIERVTLTVQKCTKRTITMYEMLCFMVGGNIMGALSPPTTTKQEHKERNHLRSAVLFPQCHHINISFLNVTVIVDTGYHQHPLA